MEIQTAKDLTRRFLLWNEADAWLTDVEMQEYCDLVLKALDQKQEQRWIPCSERLPEFAENVLMALRWDEITTGYYYGSWHDEGRNFYDDEVLAWMPLPEPYKEEQR